MHSGDKEMNIKEEERVDDTKTAGTGRGYREQAQGRNS